MGLDMTPATGIRAAFGPDGGESTIDSPLWWLVRLALLINARDGRLQLLRDYYEGRHKMAFADQAFRKNFGALFGEYAENICELVVDATAERLHVKGFRMGRQRDIEADKDAWDIWQVNQLDAQQQLVHKTSLIEGYSYVGVWSNPNDAAHPMIRVLDPRATIVAYDPEDKLRRRAALRRWNDPWTGRIFATLYLPDATYKYTAKGSVPLTPPVLPEEAERIQFGQLTGWERRTVPGEPWPLPNPLGVVPIVPFINKPTVGMEGISEIATTIPINNAINKLVSDMLLAAATGAYRQKWGINIPLLVDAAGEVTVPFEMDVDKFLAVGQTPPGESEPKFGQFDQTDLSGYIKAVEQRLQMAATITHTPHHYILGGQGSFPSGEALRAVEAPLISKVIDKMDFFGESWEEVIRLAFRVLHDPRGEIQDSETLWSDPENRTESQHVDAVTKMAALDVPKEILWEKLGFSPVEIDRMKQLLADARAAMPAAVPGATPENGMAAPGAMPANPMMPMTPANEGGGPAMPGEPIDVGGILTAPLRVRI